ncbi:MAG: glycosyltransferase family 4 protein [Planctomycetaceae bacterium]
MRRPRLLVITQVYVPDPAAVGQHIADTAEEMVRRGWDVVVLTSARGYDDPSVRYPRREMRGGVCIRRLPLSSFGKRSIAVRLVAQALFMSQAILRGLFTPGISVILVSTSPPFAGFGGRLLGLLRRVPYVWWVMDINPDQMVRAGRISARSPVARAFDWLNRQTILGARTVIVLDRFMRDTVWRKARAEGKTVVSPPWAFDNILEDVPREANPFRARHGLGDCCVVMYSGNAGYSHPLDTLLAAAKRLEHEHRLKFVFVGGGVVKKEIDAMVARERPPNIITLPYQPFSELRYSLSAADVHVVSIADEAIGVVHPCKVYGALAVGRPVIALAARDSYIGDILAGGDLGWVVEHGDVDRLVAVLEALPEMGPAAIATMGRAARHAAATTYSRATLLSRVCDTIAACAR